MNEMYEKIKQYYDNGLWNKDRIRNMVVKSVITDEEYQEIVNEEYQKQ